MQQDAIGRGNQDWRVGGQQGQSGQLESHSDSYSKSAQPSLKVLVIEDEENIVELIKLGLRYEGFQVESASDGLQGLSAAQRINPDMVILDLGLPPGSIDGLEVCRRLRINPTTQDVPILMLTAKGDVQDKITGLQTGADDYLTKPFSFEELVARIRAILRRQRRSSSGNGANGNENDADSARRILQFGDLRLNMATREVTRGGRLIELTATEYNLLHLFMSHPRQVLDRQTILNRVWGYDFLGETNIIEVYVRYLREKIEDSPSTPRLIQTVRGVGYVLKG
ncbi:MAG TPA: response regulator transcription factor [Ktedonobacteraceae bacterium]|nr:response regulator transcription factor [Ktedonobacteraceae bacterium]